jgi:hypothetical protein
MKSETKKAKGQKISVIVGIIVVVVVVVIGTLLTIGKFGQKSINLAKVNQKSFELLDSSCINSKTCVAIGSNLSSTAGIIVFTSDGGKLWHKTVINNVSNFISVGCSNSSSFCIAIGDSKSKAVIFEFRSLNWFPIDSPLINAFSSNVACNQTGCELVGTVSNSQYLFEFNGAKWDTFKIETPYSLLGISSLSCVSIYFCMAEATGLPEKNLIFNRQYLLKFDGVSWESLELPKPIFKIGSISCISVDYCVALGEVKNVATNYKYILSFNGNSWKVESLKLQTEYLGSISCASPLFCISTLTNSEHYLQYNGKKWVELNLSSNFGYLGPVNCIQVNSCISLVSPSSSNNLSYSIRDNITIFSGTRWSASLLN